MSEGSGKTFQVEFVSPETILYSGEAEQVIARTNGGGDIAFLAGHESFVGSLATSEVKVTEAGGDIKRFAVRSGFVSVVGEKITVLSDAAIAAGNIDKAAVESDLSKATEAMATDPDNVYNRADKQWAEVRLAAIGHPVG